MSQLCTKCNASPVNATGVVCDMCMITQGTVYNIPAATPQAIPQSLIPIRTDELHDKFDSYTKSFDEGLDVKVIINYTKSFSEIVIYNNGTVTDAKAYTDRQTFETTLAKVIDMITKEQEERKRKEAEKIQYFKDIKNVVSNLGFSETPVIKPAQELPKIHPHIPNVETETEVVKKRQYKTKQTT